jgi:2-hydroxymuconate-semialdehyde hydrolase
MTAYTAKNFTFEEIPVHYLEGGSGPPLLLIHGSGPGASTIGNWRTILEPLAEQFHVFAMDLIGFGLSGRLPKPPFFDMQLWQRQAAAMIAMMPDSAIGLLGHSISGALALRLAASSSRIGWLVTTGAMGARFPINDSTRLCWTFPKDVAALRETAEMLIFDHSYITDAYMQNRIEALFEDKEYKAYFSEMFSRPAEDTMAATLLTEAELKRIKIPVTMLHGRNDIAFPSSITMALAEALPQANVLLLSNCAHSVALEQSQQLLTQVQLLKPVNR